MEGILFEATCYESLVIVMVKKFVKSSCSPIVGHLHSSVSTLPNRKILYLTILKNVDLKSLILRFPVTSSPLPHSTPHPEHKVGLVYTPHNMSGIEIPMAICGPIHPRSTCVVLVS